MWMAIPKPEITGKHSENAKKYLLKTKRIVNTKLQASWELGFYI